MLGLEIDEVAFAKGEALLEGLSHGFMKFAGALAVGAAVGLAAIAKTTAEAGDEIRKLSQRVGVNSIQLQELAYAAALADVSTEELATGLQHLAKTGVKDVRLETLRLADQFANMPDGADKTRVAMEKFGRAGARLIPLLNGGSEEIAKLGEEAHTLGVIISEEDQKASEEFNDQLTRMMKALIGLRNIIGLQLIRPLTKVAVAIREFFTDIRLGAKWVQDLTLALRTFAFIAGGIVLAALLANASAIATNVSWYVALTIASARAAIASATAWLKSIAPIIAAGLAIATVLLILEDLYYFITGGKSVIGDFFDYVKEEFETFPNFFKAIGEWINSLISSAVDSAIAALGRIPGIGGLLAKAAAFGGGMVMDNVSTAASLAGKAVDFFSPSGPSTTTNSPSVATNITVNATPGMSAKELADQTVQAFDEHWNAKLRGGFAGGL